MNQPNYQFITDAQGNVVGVDRKNPQQHVDMGQIGKPASSSVEKPITLSPDSKLFPKNTSPDVLSGIQKAGWNVTQNDDGSFIGQAPPKPPTDYQANQMIRGYHKDYMQEVGKIKNIPAVVSYLKSIAPPGSQIPPVADSQFIIEYLRAANALGNFGIARINQAEMNLLQHARSLEDTAKNFYNLKIEGNLLTDEQRQGMIKTLEHMAVASKEAKGAIDKQYKTMLPSWIPPEKVIGDDDSSFPASVGPPPATGLPGGDVSVE